ncbi:MAG: C-type lectin domain-containing protein [Sandaracinaceae bacterium]|nr:C-type lectin domain-containing protein [Sandaracinaceae bacterium]
MQSTANSIVNHDWWLGATRTMPPSPDGTQLTWIDGTAVPLPTDSSGFSNWRGGQPDGSGGCVDMDPDQPSADAVNGRWEDASCSDAQRYVCESR